MISISNGNYIICDKNSFEIGNDKYKTIEFLKTNIQPASTILDLGVENPFTTIMESEGFKVANTEGEDLSLAQSLLTKRQMSDSSTSGHR